MQLAVVGHNSRAFGQDEAPKPLKLTEEQKLEFARITEDAARLLAALFRIAKHRIAGKRQGDKPLFIRFVLNHYLRGIGCPVKLAAKILGVDRCQPGEDAERMQEWAARNPTIDAALEELTAYLDAGLKVEPKLFLEHCASEVAADRAAEAAMKIAREAADLLERGAPKPEPKPITEAERLVFQGQERVRKERVAAAKRINLAIIEKGLQPGAGKEAKKHMKDALKALEEIDAEEKRAAAAKPKPKKRATPRA